MSDAGSSADQLVLHAIGVLTKTAMVTFDDHLELCGDCQSRIPQLLETAAALIPDSPAPEHTWSRIVSANERR